MNARDWKAAWAARRARLRAFNDRPPIDLDALERERREACMARHPSQLTQPVALPLGLRESAGRVLVRDAWRLEQAELVHAGGDEAPEPEVPALPVFSSRYPDAFVLPRAWVHTRWDDAWLTACQKGGAW